MVGWFCFKIFICTLRSKIIIWEVCKVHPFFFRPHFSETCHQNKGQIIPFLRNSEALVPLPGWWQHPRGFKEEVGRGHSLVSSSDRPRRSGRQLEAASVPPCPRATVRNLAPRPHVLYVRALQLANSVGNAINYSNLVRQGGGWQAFSVALKVRPRPVASWSENIPHESNYGNSVKSHDCAGYHKTHREEASIMIKEGSYHRLRFKSASGMLRKAAPSSIKSAESRRDGRRPARPKKEIKVGEGRSEE